MDTNDGHTMMSLLCKELIRRLREESKDMKAADFEMVRKLLADNSVTIASVQRGDFGDTARRVAEEFFPLPEDGDYPTH
jgi:hypothetical protein